MPTPSLLWCRITYSLLFIILIYSSSYRTHKQNEGINNGYQKRIGNCKIMEYLELKKTIYEVKISPLASNKRLMSEEQTISEIKGRAIEAIQTKVQGGKMTGKKKHMRDL